MTLIAATAAYYLVNATLRSEPFDPGAMLYWWGASVLFGPVLGAAGASIGRPGVTGLIGAPTVPVGALVQMLLLTPGTPSNLPPDLGVAPSLVESAARVFVVAAATTAIVVIVSRSRKNKPRHGLEFNLRETAS